MSELWGFRKWRDSKSLRIPAKNTSCAGLPESPLKARACLLTMPSSLPWKQLKCTPPTPQGPGNRQDRWTEPQGANFLGQCPRAESEQCSGVWVVSVGPYTASVVAEAEEGFGNHESSIGALCTVDGSKSTPETAASLTPAASLSLDYRLGCPTATPGLQHPSPPGPPPEALLPLICLASASTLHLTPCQGLQ